MGQKRKQSSRKKRDSDSLDFGRGKTFLWMFLVLITFVVYLWGKVQIEFILRKNDLLIREKITLQRRVNALRIEVNQKRRYERIVEMAKKQGLDFVSASCLKELPVDLKGLESDSPHKLDQVQYAGFSMNGI